MTKTLEITQTLELPLSPLNGHAALPPWATVTSFQWPAPPLFQRAAGAAAVPAECVIEFADGSDQTVELISIDADGRAAQVRDAGADSQALVLGGVRSITLKRPIEYVADRGAIQHAGVSAEDAMGTSAFAVQFKRGARLTGRTRGSLLGHGGVFFFLAQPDRATASPCYVPMAQVESYQVGALAEAIGCGPGERERRLAEYLAGRALASSKELKDALGSRERRPNVRIGELLTDAGLITPGELERALEVQARNRGRRIGEILISMGALSVRTLQVMLSERLGIPYVNAEAFEIDPAALDLVPQELAQAHNLLPLMRLGGSLVVAVENPLAIEFEQRLRFTTGCAIVPVIGDSRQIAARIAVEYFGPQDGAEVYEPSAPAAGASASGDDIEQLARRLERETPSAAAVMKRMAEPSVRDNTLVKLVNKIITDAHTRGVSDIHIETGAEQKVRVRFRRDGELVDYVQLRPTYAAAVVSRIKIMAGLDISERRQAQDGKIRFGRFGALAIELRVAIVPTADGSEDVVLRILGGAASRPIEKIGLAARNLTEIKRMTARHHGLVLVCGPTGSGKTTTLHSVLRHLNRADLKVWTAEDPVEIVQPGLRQVQVNPQAGWTFAQAMRSFLRADPDVIMVGEMRDAETARVAVEASLTGHLVLSTLHTNSAAETVTRLLDMGMDPFNFSDSLVGILSQRLARRLCPACRRARDLRDDEAQELAIEYCHGTALEPAAVIREWRATFAHRGRLQVNEAVGCEECDSGYRGRVGIHELLPVTPEMRHMIRLRGPADELETVAKANGMRTLKQDALEKVLAGELDVASARTASN